MLVRPTTKNIVIRALFDVILFILLCAYTLLQKKKEKLSQEIIHEVLFIQVVIGLPQHDTVYIKVFYEKVFKI